MATQKEEAGHSGIFLYPRPDNWCVSAPSPDHDFGLVEINICRIFVDSHLRMWEFHCSVGFFSLAFFLLHFLLSNQQRDLKDQLSYVLKVKPGNHQWFNKWRLREREKKIRGIARSEVGVVALMRWQFILFSCLFAAGLKSFRLFGLIIITKVNFQRFPVAHISYPAPERR